jgi:hypothetical protein
MGRPIQIASGRCSSARSTGFRGCGSTWCSIRSAPRRPLGRILSTLLPLPPDPHCGRALRELLDMAARSRWPSTRTALVGAVRHRRAGGEQRASWLHHSITDGVGMVRMTSCRSSAPRERCGPGRRPASEEPPRAEPSKGAARARYRAGENLTGLAHGVGASARSPAPAAGAEGDGEGRLGRRGLAAASAPAGARAAEPADAGALDLDPLRHALAAARGPEARRPGRGGDAQRRLRGGRGRRPADLSRAARQARRRAAHDDAGKPARRRRAWPTGRQPVRARALRDPRRSRIPSSACASTLARDQQRAELALPFTEEVSKVLAILPRAIRPGPG